MYNFTYFKYVSISFLYIFRSNSSTVDSSSFFVKRKYFLGYLCLSITTSKSRAKSSFLYIIIFSKLKIL